MRKFRCIYFQARIQVVAFLLNYEQTVFYSVILDSQNTFYLLLTFTLHLLLLDMLIPFFRRVLRACVVLFPLLGVTWVFGVLSVTDPTGIVFQYFFTICNSLQVIFGFWPWLNLYWDCINYKFRVKRCRICMLTLRKKIAYSQFSMLSYPDKP